MTNQDPTVNNTNIIDRSEVENVQVAEAVKKFLALGAV